VAQIVPLPLESAVTYTTMFHGYRRVEHGNQHLALGLVIANGAKGEAKGMADIECARGHDDRGDLQVLCDRQRAEPSVVERPLKQSHGLLADWSGWSEQDQISLVGEQALGDGGAFLVEQAPGFRDVAHERIDVRGQGSHLATVAERAQML
jgi:hypothetical protein